MSKPVSAEVTNVTDPVAALNYVDLKAQYAALRETINRRIQRVLDHGQYILGPEVREMEEQLAAFTGSRFCISVSSGTEALLISLMALDVKPGDEVITSPFSFAATPEVIALLGAVPVFADIEPDTCNINASAIEEKITGKTRAIMPVSLYGQPADMDEINRIAAVRGIPVVEDAAQSFGALYDGRHSCNLSTLGCTSFFPSKPLGCYGDGGAIFTNDERLAGACREIRVHGQSRRYHHGRIGVGGRMDTLQCAVVLGKLERFEWEIDRRIELGRRYHELLVGLPVGLLEVRAGRTSVWGQYTVLVDDRPRVQAALKERGIPTAVHYPEPLHHQPAYRAFAPWEACPESIHAAKRVMSLPMSADLTFDQQTVVAESLASVLG